MEDKIAEREATLLACVILFLLMTVIVWWLTAQFAYERAHDASSSFRAASVDQIITRIPMRG